MTHTSSYELEICLTMTHTYTHSYPRLVALQNTFFFHVYRSVSLSRMRRYTQLAYLFHQCATNLLSRHSRLADCTVRHPGVERPFSSLFLFSQMIQLFQKSFFDTVILMDMWDTIVSIVGRIEALKLVLC